MLRFPEKSHIINKLVNLTPEQKQQVNQFFATHKNLENQIDWNRGQKLTYEDFRKLMVANANTFKNKMKAMKRAPLQLAGVEEGKDYARVDAGELNPQIILAVPFNHEASRILASNGAGGTCEGEWCIAYQKNDKYWSDYTGQGDTFMIAMVIPLKKKFAFQIRDNHIDVWTPGDSRIDIEEFVTICQDAGIQVSPAQVNRWCKEAESAAEGQIERGPIYTEVNSSWQGGVDDKNPQLFELSYRVYERKSYENGDDEESEESFGSEIHVFKINKDTLTTAMMREAKAVGFDIITGHGLLISFPDNTNTPEEASRKAYTIFDSDWNDLYDDDAVHELAKFLGIAEGWEIKHQYAADYLILDTNATLNQLENDDLLMELLAKVVHFSLPKDHWDAVESENLTFITINVHYNSGVDPNSNDRVERPDGPVWYQDPDQGKLFDEARRRALLMLMGQGSPFYPQH